MGKETENGGTDVNSCDQGLLPMNGHWVPLLSLYCAIMIMSEISSTCSHVGLKPRTRIQQTFSFQSNSDLVAPLEVEERSGRKMKQSSLRHPYQEGILGETKWHLIPGVEDYPLSVWGSLGVFFFF